MSNEESVAGINVRQLRDDKQRLEDAIDMAVDANHCLQAHLLMREDRIQQLEEALEKIASAYRNMTLRERLVREPSPARLVNIADAALSREPSEAPQKGRCQCQSGSSALGQCKLEAGHTEDCAFEFSEAPEKEE